MSAQLTQESNLKREISKIEQKKAVLEKINDHRTKLFIGTREEKQEIV